MKNIIKSRSFKMGFVVTLLYSILTIMVYGVTPGDRYPYKTKYYYSSIHFDTGRNLIQINIKDYPDKRNYDILMKIVKSIRLIEN